MKDFTTGNIRKQLFFLTMPILFVNLANFANLFVNRIWAGKFLNNDAIAAISLANVLLYIALAIGIGIGTGAGTVISQYFGARKNKKIKQVLVSSLSLSILCGIVVFFVFQFFSLDVLFLINTPLKIAYMTTTYLKICSFSFVLLYPQLMIGYIFRAVGDTKKPLIFTLTALITNTILDPFLMLGLLFFPKLGVEGAGISFLISVVISFCVAWILLIKNKGVLTFVIRDILKPSFSSLVKILKYGIPTGFQNLVVSSGIAVVQSFINKYGAPAIAAYGACTIVTQIAVFFCISFGTSVSIIAGQNRGAQRLDRVVKVTKEGLMICLSTTLIITVICLIYPEIFLHIFIQAKSIKTLNIGDHYLKILAIPYLFMTVLMIFDSLFCGVGANFASMLITAIGIWGIRIPLIYILSHIFMLNGVWYGEGLSYVFTAFITGIYYFKGSWKLKGVIN
ncbi:MAG TPA: MATE family efflux transporter [Victivallales bacterium]|nr:MATE family efflux transporter [Victivallales bacterium]